MRELELETAAISQDIKQVGLAKIVCVCIRAYLVVL